MTHDSDCAKCGGKGYVTFTADLGDEFGSRPEESEPCDCYGEDDEGMAKEGGPFGLGLEGAEALNAIYDLTNEHPELEDGREACLPGWVAVVLGDDIVASGRIEDVDQVAKDALEQVQAWQVPASVPFLRDRCRERLLRALQGDRDLRDAARLALGMGHKTLLAFLEKWAQETNAANGLHPPLLGDPEWTPSAGRGPRALTAVEEWQIRYYLRRVKWL